MTEELTEGRRQATRVTWQKSAEIVALIRANSKIVEGIVIYDDGWDDARVATETGVVIDSVRYRRNVDLGPTRKPPTQKAAPTEVATPDTDALLSMIAELKSDVERVSKALRNVAVEGNFERAYRILENQN